jgi:hypothetical protein
MLSEIEHSGHSTLFLCDYDSLTTNATTTTAAIPADAQSDTTAPESDVGSEGDPTSPFPDCIILYILWTTDMESSPKAFTKGVIAESVRKLKALTENHHHNNNNNNSKECQIYVVVDSLVEYHSPNNNNDNTSNADGSKPTTTPTNETCLRKYQSQVATVEQLARCIATELRDEIQGLTVGISNHVRAAPGLEKCMEALEWGSKDRRRTKQQVQAQCQPQLQSQSHYGAAGYDHLSRSSIGIVTRHPDDLVGLQKDPDAAQNVMQSYTCAEWNGNGDIQSFAKRAHVRWCMTHDVELEEDGTPRTKAIPRRNNYPSPTTLDQLDGGALADPMTLFILLFLGIWLYVHITTSYEDGVHGFLNWLESFFVVVDRQDGVGESVKNQL